MQITTGSKFREKTVKNALANITRTAATATTAVTLSALSATAQSEVDRSVLPIATPPAAVFTELDVRNAAKPPLFQVEAPEDAPNVLIVLVDDLGFAGTSTFGGPVSTPEFDALAAEGLHFVNFHTTAVCSPTRAALKSGRNHHVNNMGGITENATAFPGNTGMIPGAVAPLAEILRLNGFSTAAFGKWHETATWETSVSGPHDRWPTRQGFDKFYGFLGGETNQWAPFVYDGVHPVDLPEDPEYHFLEDMTDQTVSWIKYQKALTPEKPFFVYFAPGATHAPHHVPQHWSARWEGKFDQGWDALREEILARQIEDGIAPEGTVLPPKPSGIPDWDSITEDEKTLFTRQVEVFAGYVEMTDHEIGRVIGAIDEIGELDNTLVFLVYGDNGTSAEGGRYGMYNEMTYFNGVQQSVEDLLEYVDVWGGPETYPHQAAGWAVGFDTPYKWMKQVGSDFGGTKVGMAIHWPDGITATGEQRDQFTHVIDVAPTVLEVVGLPEPNTVNGIPQVPMQGTSMAYLFEDADTPERHTTQYFEMFGNRAIYKDGWLARTIHKAPWEAKPRAALADDTWELFDTKSDFSLANDLSAENPDRLAALKTAFMIEAGRNHVLPIDDRTFERFDAAAVGRPDLMAGRTSITLADGMTGMGENVFLNVKNKSKTITATVDVPKDGGHGTIIAQAGRFGGWSLYVKDGVPAYAYNFL
jgi:arylsulfatase